MTRILKPLVLGYVIKVVLVGTLWLFYPEAPRRALEWARAAWVQDASAQQGRQPAESRP